MANEDTPHRRALLKQVGWALTALPLARLLGCASEGGGVKAQPAVGAATDRGGSPPDAAAADAAAVDAAVPDAALPDAALPDAVVPDATVRGWATGGTAAMAEDYGDPFAGGLGAACTLYCASTLGPCFVEAAQRRDISEGQPSCAHTGSPPSRATASARKSSRPASRC